MTGASPCATARRPQTVLLAATVAATTVTLGLTTGTGALVGPLADGYRVGTAEVSLVLAVTLCATLGLGVLTGPLAQRHGARPLVAVAALLVPTGLLIAAATDRFAVAGVALAVGVGVGAGCVVVPMTAAAGAAVDRHRGAALVIATAGGGLATVVAPPATVALLGALGLRGTLIAFAVISAMVLGAAAAAAPGRADLITKGREQRPAGQPGLASALSEPGLRRLLAATVVLAAAMFVPVVHLPGYAVAHGSSLATGAAMVTLAGAASLVARLVAVPAVSRWGAWRVQRAGAAVFTAALGTWTLTDGPAGLAAVAVAFGLGHGAYVGVSGAVLAQLYGVTGLGLRLGLVYLAGATGGLIGPAAAGAIADLTGTPVAAAVLATTLGAAGCILQMTIRTEPVPAAPGSRGPAGPGSLDARHHAVNR